MKGLLKRLFGGRDEEAEQTGARRQPLYIPDPTAAKARPKPANKKPGELELSDAGSESMKPSGGFDPYNTGAFNRSDSWEKISKQRDR